MFSIPASLKSAPCGEKHLLQMLLDVLMCFQLKTYEPLKGAR